MGIFDFLKTVRVGKRRFDSLEDFVHWTERTNGLTARVEPATFFSRGLPLVRFHGSTEALRPVEISYESRSTGDEAGSTYYVVHFRVNDVDPISIDITREGLLRQFGRWLGIASDVEAGDVAFDREFWIKTPDERGARRAFASGLKEAVRSLFDRRFNRLRLQGGVLAVEATADDVDPGTYREVLSLLDQAAASVERVEIRVSALRSHRKAFRDARGATRCAFCHGAITGEEPYLVACERCHTVLHDDCWLELGHCPVLGCPGHRAERPR